MPPDRGHHRLFLCLLLLTTVTGITVRPSCRHHYLANHRTTSVYPVGTQDASSNIVCRMPSSFDGESTVVVTEIHSGLEAGHTVVDRRSVNYQVSDLDWLRELVRTASCEQTVTVEWDKPPEKDKGSISLVSLLNETVRVVYDKALPVQRVSMAGVRHLLPDDVLSVSDGPTVSASVLECTQKVVSHRQCLAQGKVEVDVASSSSFSYSFSFRSDRSDQMIVSHHSADGTTTTVRVEDDFFLRVGSGDVMPVGQLSDSNWHTVVVNVDSQQLRVTVDDKELAPVQVTRVTIIELSLEGEIFLIDERHTRDDCQGIAASWKQSRPISNSLCSGCGCSLLEDSFEGLHPVNCEKHDDDGFQLLRDADRLSFFLVPDGFTVSDEGAVDIRTALRFSSDADAGLLMFGFWQGLGGGSRGRFQVHYNAATTSAVLCRSVGEEYCMACSVRSSKDIGSSADHLVVFRGAAEQFSLVVDSEVCVLKPVERGNNISTAEVYSNPSISRGIGLFVGGTYYEKKRSDLYNVDMEHKYFENTREKMPSLRGCVKEVFANGRKLDLISVYQNQMRDTLLDPEDLQAYAIQIGCSTCLPPCASSVRCRVPSALPGSTAQCDCSDTEHVTNQGVCEQRQVSPVPLSTRFVHSNPVVVPLETTKAVLARLWIKFSLPEGLRKRTMVAEFNSHREVMFRVYASPEGIQVQAHPHDINDLASTVTKPVDLSDDRVHSVSMVRRTPVGTRHSARRYSLIIDGMSYSLPDAGRSWLNNVSFHIEDGLTETESVVIHDIGVGFDYDEHMYLMHPTNKIHQMDIHSRLLSHMYRIPDVSKSGTLDPYLWIEQPSAPDSPVSSNSEPTSSSSMTSFPVVASPHGKIVGYTPDSTQPELLLSGRWLFYSMVVCVLLSLLVLLFICLYCCFCRNKSAASQASDRELMRDSPDYMPVKMRRHSEHSEERSFDGDGSLGTDDTDLHAYRDIPSHRVKIYRESMVSILVPSMDEPCEAALVRRISAEVPSSPSPQPGSPAPLVSVTEEEQ